jgi:hypothetical protein
MNKEAPHWDLSGEDNKEITRFIVLDVAFEETAIGSTTMSVVEKVKPKKNLVQIMMIQTKSISTNS